MQGTSDKVQPLRMDSLYLCFPQGLGNLVLTVKLGPLGNFWFVCEHERASKREGGVLCVVVEGDMKGGPACIPSFCVEFTKAEEYGFPLGLDGKLEHLFSS